MDATNDNLPVPVVQCTPTVRNLLKPPFEPLPKLTKVPLINGRFEACRLAFHNVAPKQRIDYGRIAWFIKNYNPPDMSFYLDTNFLTGEEKPDELWDALLERRIVITPTVWEELHSWLGTPFRNRRMRNILLDARLCKNPSIDFSPNLFWHPYVTLAHAYYVNLLGMRKRMPRILAEGFEQDHGRAPTEAELDSLIQRKAADHEFRLAKKGKEDITKSNFLADEELVAFAACDAIVRGQKTTILTTDTDVQVQFVKMMRLLDHQYQAFLFAEKYAASPDSFSKKPLVRTTPELEYYLADDDGLLIEKPCAPGRQFVEWLLPERYHMNSVYCLLFGGRGEHLVFSPLDYSAERDMLRLLMVKGETAGRNTSCLGEFNCHVTGFPVGIEDPRQWVIVARDKGEKHGLLSYAYQDMAAGGFERGPVVTLG